MSVCQTVDVPAPEADSSFAEVRNFKVTTPGTEAVTVEFDLLNRIESGDGETLDVSVPILIDGSEASTATATLGPGEGQFIEQTLTAPSGQVEVCVGGVE